MSNQILKECVSCGNDWKSRKPTRYDTDTKTIPMIFEMQILSEFGKKRIKLIFCDMHGNNPGFRHATRFVNGTGVLQIRNVKTNRWRNAEKIGVVVGWRREIKLNNCISDYDYLKCESCGCDIQEHEGGKSSPCLRCSSHECEGYQWE